MLMAGKQAMAEPLPGSVRDAFAVSPDIQCGRYTVRPCYDADIEWLSLLGHPLHEMRLRRESSQDGKVENLYEPRGRYAWELFYMLTHPVDEVDELMAKDGLEAFRAAAKKEFSRLQFHGLLKLSEACLAQYARYWDPTLSYGPASDGEESPAGSQIQKKTSSGTASASS